METIYCKEAPSNQTLVDILKGSWLSAFPEEYHVNAGSIRHFDFNVDPRVKWGAAVLKEGIKDRTVLELGPFEAYNTWQLEQLGAKSLTAIEACNLSYLKCLIVKEMMGLKARFLYGDFIPFLEQNKERYDLIWASGVLYHQVEPLKLLGLIARATDRVFIHTHYYLENMIKGKHGVTENFISRKDTDVKYEGYKARLHYRSYDVDKTAPIFAGGSQAFSYWMEQKDIFGLLRHLGFNKIQTGVDDPNNPNGPAMFFVAEREA